MPVRRVIKAIFRKARRSSFYYLMVCNLPVKRASERQTGADALGMMIVIILLAGMVGLMRYLLTS